MNHRKDATPSEGHPSLGRSFFLILLLPVVLAAVPLAAASWFGEFSVAGSLNNDGLCAELELSRRIDLADPSAWLTGKAHLDIGTFISVYPVGYNATARIVWRPLLFLDLGCMAGLHGSWEFYEFSGPVARYGPAVRDRMGSGCETIPYVSPFAVLKAAVGPVVSYNSFYFERYARDRGYWMNWYYEALMENDWLVNVNNYIYVMLGDGWALTALSKYVYTADNRETKWLVGGGAALMLADGMKFGLSLGYHLREANYSGFRVLSSWAVPFTL